ncbi:cyanophycinase [Longimicrobium sp.]|uniref:cyanophycinase n=1 Tax=Longimicrobium sp. TaxID=2029185 RepID=UPI003B3B6330
MVNLNVMRQLRTRTGIAILMVLAACAPSAGPAGAPGVEGVRGHLLIVGGGGQPPELVARFVELAGGEGKARIAVLPMASAEPEASGTEQAEELRGLGADAFVLHLTREQAMTDSAARLLDGATGIWFTGGDQSRVTPVLRGSPVLDAIRARWREGAVVGGTSAGAAVMPDSMLTGNQFRAGEDTAGYYGDDFPEVARRTIQVAPGLGFLPGTLIDQHFIRRERHNRLLAVVLERPALIGVGIDESTAIEVGPDGHWTVRGSSAVFIYDARRARITSTAAPVLGTSGVRMHLLPSGAVFDPRTGEARLP